MTEQDASMFSEEDLRRLMDNQGDRRREDYEERGYPLSQFTRKINQRYRDLILRKETVKTSEMKK